MFRRICIYCIVTLSSRKITSKTYILYTSRIFEVTERAYKYSCSIANGFIITSVFYCCCCYCYRVTWFIETRISYVNYRISVMRIVHTRRPLPNCYNGIVIYRSTENKRVVTRLRAKISLRTRCLRLASAGTHSPGLAASLRAIEYETTRRPRRRRRVTDDS